MDLHKHIDIYCERVQPGLWDEPLNAISNAAFIVASFAAFVCAQKRGVLTLPIIGLIIMIAAIGIGSGLFHTFANTWSKLADVLPIMLFKILFIACYSRFVMRGGIAQTFGLIALFFGLSFLSGLMPYDWLNGSLAYSPALIFLLGFGIYHRAAGKDEASILFWAAGVFVISLIFRSTDMLVCDMLPIGVHYMWHILNSIVLYLSVRAIIVNMPRQDIR